MGYWITDEANNANMVVDKSMRCVMLTGKAMDLVAAAERAHAAGKLVEAQQWADDARNTAKWAVRAAGDAMYHAAKAVTV